MQYHLLGQTGFSASVLGFGAAPIGYLETAQREVSDLLNLLLDRGVNVVDTASGYAGSEEAIAQAVGHRRDEFFLVSKCGRELADAPGAAWSAELVTATVDRSLRRLRTDRLDAMLLHSCEVDVLKGNEALGALFAARDAGKVRFVGYSGDNEAAAFAAALPEIAVLETSVNLCDQANARDPLRLAMEGKVGVLAKRPLANAPWRAKSEFPGIYGDYAAPYVRRFRALGLRAEDLGFGEADWPEIALRFTLSEPGVHTAIVGTTRRASAEANLRAAEKGPLPALAAEKIRHAFHHAETAGGEAWPGLT